MRRPADTLRQFVMERDQVNWIVVQNWLWSASFRQMSCQAVRLLGGLHCVDCRESAGFPPTVQRHTGPEKGTSVYLYLTADSEDRYEIFITCNKRSTAGMKPGTLGCFLHHCLSFSSVIDWWFLQVASRLRSALPPPPMLNGWNSTVVMTIIIYATSLCLIV